MAAGRIGVLIVDDSAAVRVALSRIVASAGDMEVIGSAGDPYAAVEQMRQRKPDVVVLDIQMPRMDGLTFLRRIMQQHPLPVVICSAFVGEGSENAVRALEYGAVELVPKPSTVGTGLVGTTGELLIDAIRAAAAARVERREGWSRPVSISATVGCKSVMRPKETSRREVDVIAIGASTGGTEAVRTILRGLPHDIPGIVVAQHMAEQFTRIFADNLDSQCDLAVTEARDGDAVRPGRVLVAPGNRHVGLRATSHGVAVVVTEEPPVNRHRPSVDVLFTSVASVAGARAVGVLLTGMGDDGARGLLEMRQAGAVTIAQDEATSVVWGMPGAAVTLGAAQHVLPVQLIANAVAALCVGPRQGAGRGI